MGVAIFDLSCDTSWRSRIADFRFSIGKKAMDLVEPERLGFVSPGRSPGCRLLLK
jgi:hypothetical protein